MHNAAVLVGSLRKDSINRKVAHALIELAPASLKLALAEIGQLPIYNQDEDASPPAVRSLCLIGPGLDQDSWRSSLP